MEKILAINPGSTSTKIAVYEEDKEIFERVVRHKNSELEYGKYISEQYDFRKKVILDALEEAGIDIKKITAVVGRGGMIRPLEGGTYFINDEMLQDCRVGYAGQHACNLGALISDEIGKKLGIPSYIVDPPVVDEMSDIAKVTGLPEIQRRSLFHALNHKAVVLRAAEELGKKYEDLNIIVAMLGGGISIGIHEKGKVVDVNDAFDGEGPFSPERSGSLPLGYLVGRCFASDNNMDEIKKKIVGSGGVTAHLGTNDMREVGKKIEEGDAYAKLIYEAMAYQIAKSIGALSVVTNGKIDAIVISGGIAYDEKFVEKIKERVSFIGKVFVYPGEDEMQALANGALRVLRGEEKAKNYKPELL
ncbi:MAG: butyrate kinase [Peptostreptococcales bacterium]